MNIADKTKHIHYFTIHLHFNFSKTELILYDFLYYLISGILVLIGFWFLVRPEEPSQTFWSGGGGVGSKAVVGKHHAEPPQEVKISEVIPKKAEYVSVKSNFLTIHKPIHL